MRRVKKIAIAAPASAAEQIEILKSIEVLQSRYQVEVIYGDDVWKRGDAESRAAIFLKYALDDSVDMILAARGGEGSADIMPYLVPHHEAIANAKPKIISGMSDLTAILFYFYQTFKWPVIHGYCAVHFARELAKGSVESFDTILNEETVCIDELKPLNDLAVNAQKITAKIVGGNLTMLNLSIKDVWEFDATNKVLFIEDWHEKGYAVFRTLKYLARIGKLNNVKALIFGDFLCADIVGDPDKNAFQREYLVKCLSRFSDGCDFPVFQTDWIGHGNKMKNIFFGEAEIDKGQLYVGRIRCT